MVITSRQGPASNTVVFDSTDLGRTEEFLSTSYAPMRIGSTTGRAGARITRVTAGAVSVDQLDLSFEMSYDVRPLGKICLCDIDSGTIEDHHVAGWQKPEAFGPGELFSFSPPDLPYRGRIRQARYTITMFVPDLLVRVIGGERPVRLLDHRPRSAAAARHVRTTITYLRDNVLADPEVSDNPLVVSTASQYLAATVLNAFPNTAHTDRSTRDAHPGALRRAIAFIEANAHRDIDAADIARAAHASVRAVQLAFRRHLDMTPMAYLRQVRLDSAHAELRAANPEQTTVTRVAARWGYARPSVFAARYRAVYGRTPSQTLRTD
jgi:AraC-like DNA-binding protein